MTILSIVQQACKRIGIPSPSTAVGNTSENIIRLVALANEEGEELAQRHRWQKLISEATFVTAAAESQGAMTTLAGASFGWICGDTVWNRTSDRKWFPISDVDWQRMKANGITGPEYYYRIRGGNFIVQPVPTAGETVAFEWVTKNWCESSGGTDQSAWAADTDVGLLDESVMTEGIIWRWKQANGFEYAEDFARYEKRLANLIARDGTSGRVHMGRGRTLSRNVPEGSWTL